MVSVNKESNFEICLLKKYRWSLFELGKQSKYLFFGSLFMLVIIPLVIIELRSDLENQIFEI